MGNDSTTVDGVEHRELIASEPGRIDSVLAAACPDLSRARIQRLIAEGLISLNGLAVRKSVQVSVGDTLQVAVPLVAHESSAVQLDLPILYEDGDVVVINKPAGIAVHGGPGDTAPTVASWFVQRYPGESARFDAERPGIVHRLDKDTSGVLLVAKTPLAQAAASRAFAGRETQKEYIAVCDGVPARERAVVEGDIARHPGDRTRMAIARRGRAARTEYTMLATDGRRSLLLVHPVTGRTHQIRVHLAAIGIPVSCDRVYGKPGATRQLLHAWRLRIPHPSGGTLTVTAPLPADILEAVALMDAAEQASPYSRAEPPSRTPEESI